MMKRSLLIFPLLAALLLVNCSKRQHYTINGALGALDSPATVYLLEAKDGASIVRDSAILDNGKFTFEGDIDTVISIVIMLNNDGTGHELANDGKGFFLEKGSILINSDNGSLRNAIISGTPNNDAQLRFNEEVSLPLQEMYAELTKKQEKATPEMLEDDVFTAELAAAEEQYREDALRLHGDFIEANPDVVVSLNQLMGMVDIVATERVEYLYNNLSNDLKQSIVGQELATKIERLKLFEIGAILPGLTLPDTSGNPISPSDFKGQYLLIDLWAAWCTPCRVENPNLVAMYHKYQNQNFNILGISLDRSREEWLEAIQKDGLTWPQVSDLKYLNSAAVAHFGIGGIPASYLIDPSGKIIAKDLRGQVLQNKLKELLEEGT